MTRSLALLLTLAMSSAATAHFPWIYVTDEAYPRLFFGEGIDERDYHLPDAVATAEVWQSGIDAPAKRLAMETLEEDGFVGLEGEDPIEPRGRIQTTITYGAYHGSKLMYYVQHFPAENPNTWPQTPAKDVPLQAGLKLEDGQLAVEVLWRGEPLADTAVSLTNEAGGDSQKAKTDGSGVATFAADTIGEGLNGLMVMQVDKEDSGKVDGEDYASATHILTATFNHDPTAAEKVSALPPLPEAVASFGAVVSDGWLYVYSGHIGQAHDHSRDNLSPHFRRLRLDDPGEWEELAMGQPLQGLPLVAHGGKLYRVGGLDAHNASGDEEDLHSVDRFASYDPADDTWTELPPLPAARSSHNAVVLGDTLYVLGGWRLDGDDDGEWQSGALSYDLTDAGAKWQELPEPPFKRRALAVGHVDGRVAVMCGMTDEGKLSKQVFLYDPVAQEWAEGPEFPGKAFHGFGLSAWNVDGTLYAGGMEGVLYRLDGEQNEWTKTADFSTKRFFHQLVPAGEGALFAVAGASPSEGHVATIERIDPTAPQPEQAEKAPVEQAVNHEPGHAHAHEHAHAH